MSWYRVGLAASLASRRPAVLRSGKVPEIGLYGLVDEGLELCISSPLSNTRKYTVYEVQPGDDLVSQSGEKFVPGDVRELPEVTG